MARRPEGGAGPAYREGSQGEREFCPAEKRPPRTQAHEKAGVRWDVAQQAYPAPKATMFFRLLAAIPAEPMQPILSAWQEEVLGPLPAEEPLRIVEGKELRSAIVSERS